MVQAKHKIFERQRQKSHKIFGNIVGKLFLINPVRIRSLRVRRWKFLIEFSNRKSFLCLPNFHSLCRSRSNSILFQQNEVFIGDVNRVGSSSGGNNNNNIDDDDIIPPNFPPPPVKSMLRRNSSITKHHQQANCAAPATQAINQNPSVEFARPNSSALPPLSKPDLFNFATNPPIESVKSCQPMVDDGQKAHPEPIGVHTNGNNCQSKLAYPLIFCDDHQLYDKENSFYLYHHEPASYLPNYDNISSKYPDKYNTMDCGSGQMLPLQHFNIPISKLHASTCNLNNQFNSSNLINGHHFSNSLSNFNMMDPHQQIQNYYNFNPSFTQLPEAMRRSGGVVAGMPGAFGSSSIIGSSFASNISLNGTPKQQANMPWKHRQCSSRSSSSGTNSSSKFICIHCFDELASMTEHVRAFFFWKDVSCNSFIVTMHSIWLHCLHCEVKVFPLSPKQR